MSGREPLIRAVDAIQVPVPDLEAGLAFYRDALGHELRWRSDEAAGLGVPDAATELVLETRRRQFEPNLLVDDVESAVARFVEAGGTVASEPEEIPVGRVAVVRDPFGNHLVLLDLSKGRYTTDESGRITGVDPGRDE
jgi:predicted enzyme related to lactoylglutathione lyase